MRWMLLVLGAGCTITASDQVRRFDGDVERIEVRLSNGDLELVGTMADTIEVEESFGGVGNIEAYVDGDTLVLDYGCLLCGGDVTVAVPDGVAVDAELLAGDLSLVDLGGSVVADVRAGAIEGRGLTCFTSLSAGSGAIELAYEDTLVYVEATASTGSIDVEVPEGAYDMALSAGTGVVETFGVVHDEAARGVLDLRANMGSVEVFGR